MNYHLQVIPMILNIKINPKMISNIFLVRIIFSNNSNNHKIKIQKKKIKKKINSQFFGNKRVTLKVLLNLIKIIFNNLKKVTMKILFTAIKIFQNQYLIYLK